jgi:hypothetical protein
VHLLGAPQHDKQDFDHSNGLLAKLQRKLATLQRQHWHQYAAAFGYTTTASKAAQKVGRGKRSDAPSGHTQARKAARQESHEEVMLADDDTEEEEEEEVVVEGTGQARVVTDEGCAHGVDATEMVDGGEPSHVTKCSRRALANPTWNPSQEAVDERTGLAPNDAVPVPVIAEHYDAAAEANEELRLVLRQAEDELDQLKKWKEEAARLMGALGVSLAFPLPGTLPTRAV